jgi:type II secretory pathway pseudopilin PulG
MKSVAESGMTLSETLVALLLLSACLLSVAPMFIHAMHDNAVSSDMGAANAAATAQLERLRELDYGSPDLSAGGSLTVNTNTGGIDYFDDSDPGVLVRWEIIDNTTPPRTKIIAIRAVATQPAIGRPKETTVVTLRGE